MVNFFFFAFVLSAHFLLLLKKEKMIIIVNYCVDEGFRCMTQMNHLGIDFES